MSNSQNTAETASTAAAKLSPPAAVLGAHIMGMTVADWIQWLTLIYLALMILHKIWTMWNEFKEAWVSR